MRLYNSKKQRGEFATQAVPAGFTWRPLGRPIGHGLGLAHACVYAYCSGSYGRYIKSPGCTARCATIIYTALPRGKLCRYTVRSHLLQATGH
jgi:hypothetical protein